MIYKILVVDDELTLLSTIQAYLEREGYEVQTAADGRAALYHYRNFDPDLIVLDIMLPEIDGLEVLRQLRQDSDEVYVIMLTAKADETDKVIGLGMGADDYLTKPFSPRELVARIKAALRRLGGKSTPKEFVSAHLRLDEEGRMAWKEGQSLDLTPIEFELMQTLMRHQGRVFSREQLIEQVWGHDYYGDARVVDVHIGRLRKKIEADATHPKIIATVWGAGYRFEDKS